MYLRKYGKILKFKKKYMNFNIKYKDILIKNLIKRNLNKKYVDWLNDDLINKYSEQRHQKHTLKSIEDFYNLQKKKWKFLAGNFLLS